MRENPILKYYVYTNESGEDVYITESGSILPNKFLNWDYR